ncbi:MAG: carboxypeptidase regulatory-like domain-containing protein [Planctomycetota bacterium]
MNRTAFLVPAVLALLALLLWVVGGEARVATGPATAPAAQGLEAAPESELADVAPLIAPVASATPVARQVAEAEPPATPQEQAEGVDASCIVFGRVVDEAGAPIASADVILAGYKAWAEGVETPRVDERTDLRGFRASTDLDGRFRFAVPPPTVPRQRLQVRPSRFLDSFERWYGDGARGNEPGFAAGERDLGELRLARTGAITGRVVDDYGRPIEGAEVGTGPNRSSTYSRGGWSDPDGRFEVPHAQVGTYGVKAKKEGWVSAFHDGVTVEPGRETPGIELVLSPAKTIEGRVTDPTGAPIANVKLWGWPRSSGSGAGARSMEDGRFAVSLPQDEPYTLEATLDGYAPWGGGRERHFAPGTRDLEIVLEPLERTRFRAVDDATGAPLTRFGVDILADNGSKSPRSSYTERRRPKIEDRPEGVLARTARPGIDLFVATADGYLMATGDVEHGPNGEAEQTIRLRRAAVVMGRALLDGAPVAYAPVQLAIVTPEHRDAIRRSMSLAELLEARSAAPIWYRTRENGTTAGRTDAEGRFALSPIDSGPLRLTVDVGRGATLQRLPLHVAPGATVDLGDLEAEASGAIAGVVRTPPNISPAGLSVYLDNWKDDIRVTVDGAGHFKLVDVAPGSHLLTLEGRPGELVAPPSVAVEVESGATATATLDATECGVCRVRVRVTGPGTDGFEGASVWPKWQDSELQPSHGSSLGQLDSDGKTEGTLRAKGHVTLNMRSPSGTAFEFPDQVVDLEAAAEVEVELALTLGALTLTLPPDLALPERPQFTVEAVTPNGTPATWSHLGAAVADRAIQVTSCPAGTWTLSLRIVDLSLPMMEQPQPDGSMRYSRPVVYESQVEVELAPGGDLVVALQ